MPKKYFARCTYMWGQWVNSPCFPFFPPSPLFCSHRFHPLSSFLLLLPKGTMYRISKQRRKLSRARQKKGILFFLRRIMCEGNVCPCLNKHRPVAPPPLCPLWNFMEEEPPVSSHYLRKRRKKPVFQDFLGGGEAQISQREKKEVSSATCTVWNSVVLLNNGGGWCIEGREEEKYLWEIAVCSSCCSNSSYTTKGGDIPGIPGLLTTARP